MLARDSAVRIGAASVLLLASLVAVRWPQAAAAVDDTPTYAFTDLGAYFVPTGVNARSVVSGVQQSAYGNGGPLVWQDGNTTALSFDAGHTAGYYGYAQATVGVTDSGAIVGNETTDESYGVGTRIVVWTPDGTGYSRHSFTHNAQASAVDPVSGNIGLVINAGQDESAYATSGSISDLTGTQFTDLAKNTSVDGATAGSFVGELWHSDGSFETIAGTISTREFTVLPFDPHYGNSIASDGTIVGYVGTSGAGEIRSANGTIASIPIVRPWFVDAAHDAASTSQLLIDGTSTPIEVASMLPAGWTLGAVTALGQNGSLVGYATAPDGHQHGFLLRRPAVSGTVYGVHCTASSCSRSGIKGQLVLVKGTTAAGEAFSATTRTDGKGRYDLDVPAGSYQVGPAFSGSEAFVGSAFDPETYTVTLGKKAATDKDFEVCAGGAASAANTRTSFARAAVAETTKTSACESVYTVSMQASLPSGTVVDPSSYARYNRNSAAGDGDYRDSFGRVDSILHTYPFTSKAAGVAREYPACLTEAQLKKLDGKNIDWYSQFEGGSSLGQLKVTLAVLQGKTGDTVRVVGEPTVSNPKVTKVWHYRYKDGGKYVYDSCHLDEHAKPVVVPIAGAEPGRSGLDSSQFAIAVAWAFPYDPTGLSLRTEPTGVAAILHHFGQLGETLYKTYEKLPEWGKLIVDTIIGFAIGGKYVKAVKKSADLISKFAPALKYLPKLAGVTAEGLHFALAARDFVYYFAGYAGDYPIMGSVVRGNFTPHYCSWHGVKSDFVCGSIISLGAESAKFPDIELKIRRDAKDKTASEGGDTVYTGKYLPWHGISAGGSIVSFNPFSHNGNYLLSDTNGHSYHSGTNAVTAITDATEGHDALKPLERGVEEDATPVADFDTILADLPDPTCNTDADAAHDRAHTICYYIHDGRP